MGSWPALILAGKENRSIGNGSPGTLTLLERSCELHWTRSISNRNTQRNCWSCSNDSFWTSPTGYGCEGIGNSSGKNWLAAPTPLESLHAIAYAQGPLLEMRAHEGESYNFAEQRDALLPALAADRRHRRVPDTGCCAPIEGRHPCDGC
jgi:hypothetical protein